MITIIFILLWTLPTFIITYGLSFAYWQGKHPVLTKDRYWEDGAISLCSALVFTNVGPFGILLALFFYKGYGFKFK